MKHDISENIKNNNGFHCKTLWLRGKKEPKRTGGIELDVRAG